MRYPFLHPCTILIAGPSRSGKTVFVRQLIEEHALEPFPERIVIIYNDWQPEYDKILQIEPKAEFLKGPITKDLYDTFNPNTRNLLIVDDQMLEASKNSMMEKFFIQGCHHRNLTVIFIVQNLFPKGNGMRTTSLNSNYLVLFKAPRDKSQPAILARQMYPTKWRAFQSAFEKATAQPYSHFLIDLMPSTPDELRLRGNTFPREENPGIDVYSI